MAGRCAGPFHVEGELDERAKLSRRGGGTCSPAERYDADPGGWVRDRHLQAVQAIRRDQGPARARALALQLIALGELSAEDVTGVLGEHDTGPMA